MGCLETRTKTDEGKEPPPKLDLSCQSLKHSGYHTLKYKMAVKTFQCLQYFLGLREARKQSRQGWHSWQDWLQDCEKIVRNALLTGPLIARLILQHKQEENDMLG